MSAAVDDVEAAEPRRGLGRFLGLTTLGAILPGSGLLLSGRRIIGGLLLFCFVALVVGAAAFVYVKGPTNAALFLGVRPNLLIGLVAAGIVGLLILAASIIHTAAINWPSRPQTARPTPPATRSSPPPSSARRPSAPPSATGRR